MHSLLHKKPLLIFFSLMIINVVYAQNNFIASKKANQLIFKAEYKKGIEAYKVILNRDSSYYRANKGLADTYYRLEKYDSAKVYYANSIQYAKKNTDFIDLYYYAQSLRLTDEPEEAIKTFELFEEKHNFNKRTLYFKEHLNLIKAYCNEQITNSKNVNNKVLITNLGEDINTEKSEYGCVYLSLDSSIFYTGRYKDYESEYEVVDDKYIENIYTYNFNTNKTRLFSNGYQQYTHYSIVNKVGDSDSLIIYHQNILWIIRGENSEKLIPLPIELQGYYHQPSGEFSEDQNTFIFSASKTKKDDLDIYISKKDKNGIWSTPLIITALSSDFDDDSPFLDNGDSVVYYSSKGFNSAGDYDIFKSSLVNGEWSAPINLGYPVNSPGDDIFFIKNQNQIFLSSNRREGFGSMDIYEISVPPTPTFDCETFENPELTVLFDLSESLDSNSVDLAFNWLFEDGETFTGPTVNKTFLFPGMHIVNIDVVDTESGFTEKEEVSKVINLENINYIGYSYPYKAYHDSLIQLDAGVSYIDGQSIEEYHWKIKDSIIHSSDSKLDYRFTELGEQTVYLEVSTLKNNSYTNYCYSNKLNIISYIDTNNLNPFKNGNGDSLLLANNTDGTNTTNSDSLNEFYENNHLVDSLDFDPIYFDFDKSYVTKKSRSKLDSLIVFLEKYPETKLVINGHTDGFGSDSYNIKLSQRRIKSTIKYLVNNGLDANRIYKSIAHGESKPSEPNTLPNGKDNKKGRSLNRRVEFNIFILNE